MDSNAAGARPSDAAEGAGAVAEAVVERLAAPVSRPAAALLADRIVAAIALGDFQPGQRLPSERDLTELLGIGRTTVREALALVTAAGLLEVRRGRHGGAFVKGPWASESAQAVRDLLEPEWARFEETFDMRRLVEALVARTAAERRTPSDSREIARALRQYETATDLVTAQAADLRLHHAVARATQNPRLLDLRQQLLSEVSFGFVVEPFTRAIYDRALPQHQELAAAVISGDARAAWDIGSQHFTITEDELRSALVRAVGQHEATDAPQR